MWANPKARVLEDDGQITIVEVSGMLCEWGGARSVRAALAGLDGVTSVEHEAGTDVFIVKHNGPLSDAAQTVDCVVIFKWARAGEAAAGSPKGTRSELHITLVTIGSRGDIQPYIALGQGRQPRDLAVNDQSIRQRSAHIGELIRNAAGAQRVVEIYQRYSA